MSTFRAQAIAGKVVIVHDMPDQTVISELDVEQADVLLQQLEHAKRAVFRQLCGQELSTATSGLGAWANTAPA